jgi:hypothetical protein
MNDNFSKAHLMSKKLMAYPKQVYLTLLFKRNSRTNASVREKIIATDK